MTEEIDWHTFKKVVKNLSDSGENNPNLKRWIEQFKNFTPGFSSHKGIITSVDFETKTEVVKWFIKNSFTMPHWLDKKNIRYDFKLTYKVLKNPVLFLDRLTFMKISLFRGRNISDITDPVMLAEVRKICNIVGNKFVTRITLLNFTKRECLDELSKMFNISRHLVFRLKDRLAKYF